MFHDFLPPTYSTYLFFGVFYWGYLHCILCYCAVSYQQNMYKYPDSYTHTHTYIITELSLNSPVFPILRSRFSTLFIMLWTFLGPYSNICLVISFLESRAERRVKYFEWALLCNVITKWERYRVSRFHVYMLSSLITAYCNNNKSTSAIPTA